MNSPRATGLKEILLILVSMIAGALFVYYAFNLGYGARPEEMRVFGNPEMAVVSTPSGISSAATVIPATPTAAATRAATATAVAPAAAAPIVASPTTVAPPAVSPTTPPAAVAPTNVPPTAIPPTVAAVSPVTLGKAVFDKSCNSCHPGGSKGVGPALNTADFKQRYPQDANLQSVIRNGKGAMMPGFGASQVSDSDLANLVSFIRSLAQ